MSEENEAMGAALAAPTGEQEQTQSIDDFIGSQIDALDEGQTEQQDETADAAPEVATEGDENTGDEPETTDVDESEETTEADAATEAIQPPQSMSAKDRESFHKLPPEQQKWVSERVKQMEADYTRKTMDLAEKSKTFDGIEQIMAPRRQALAMNGMDDKTAIGQLFAYSDFAERDPVGFARHLLEQRGIPLSALTEPGQQADPQLIAMQQQLASVTNHLTSQEAQQRAQTEQAITAAVEEFANDAAFPYYAELEGEMVPIVASLRQTNPSLTHRQSLEKAYRMAMAASDEVSAKVEADKQAKAEAERIKKAKEESAKAKKASATNVRSAPSLPAGATKAKSVDEFIGALVDDRMAS